MARCRVHHGFVAGIADDRLIAVIGNQQRFAKLAQFQLAEWVLPKFGVAPPAN